MPSSAIGVLDFAMRTGRLRGIKTISQFLAIAAFLPGCSFGQSSPASIPASTDLAKTIIAMVGEPAVSHAHWGVMVTAMDGSPIFGLNEGQFFQPASNAKLFTTAAALALLNQTTFETRLVAKGRFPESTTLVGNLVLEGGGDANLSGRPVPYAEPGTTAKSLPPLHFLEEMADAVAASGIKLIQGDIVGDGTLFPYEPYATDWAIDDAVWGYGAPVSALTINDNQIKLTIKPGAFSAAPAVVTLDPDIPYYSIDTSSLLTGPAKSGSHIQIERSIGAKHLRIYGSIALNASPDVEELAIEDPAEYAAIALKSELEARGVLVTGVARAQHRLPTHTRGFLEESRETLPGMQMSRIDAYGRVPSMSGEGCDPCDPKMMTSEKLVASHESPSLLKDVAITNKESQNLHAELMLRQLGAFLGTDGSIAQGARVVRQFLVNAGLDKEDFVFYDGSGLSGHDLVTPRAIAKLLQFAATQPWFATYKASLPVGGIDGSLTSRFTKPPLKGHVFAKTGTLGEARALSGYLECASGRTVIFSILSGNHAPGTSADRETTDRIVAAIAAAN